MSRQPVALICEYDFKVQLNMALSPIVYFYVLNGLLPCYACYMSRYSHTTLLDILIVFGVEATPDFFSLLHLPRMNPSGFVWVCVILVHRHQHN